MAKKPRKKIKPRPKPYRAARFGILNHFGEVWTSETFKTPNEAQGYLEQQRRIYGELPKHKVAAVRVAISIAAA
jgi:hypothetical protein